MSLKHLTYQPPRDLHDVQIIMFHGFGADYQDLFALGEMIAPEYTWIFPNGPIEVPINFSWTGRAWWKIDMNRIASPDYDFTGEIPKQLPETRKVALNWAEKNKIDWSKTIIGGFSQGGMLALDLFLNAPVRPRGLMLLSSALINKQEQLALVKNREGARFFLTHGRQDPVLPYRCAQQLENFLVQNGLRGKLVGFEGGHEIPAHLLPLAKKYIDEVAKG